MKQHLIFIFTLFFLIACRKNNSSGELPDIYNYLTKEQLELTPYFTNPEFDTLVFLSDKGDTLSFAKTKVDTSYYTYNGAWGHENTQWVHNQKLTIRYRTIKGECILKIEQAIDASGESIYTFDICELNFYTRDYFIIKPQNWTYFFDSLEIQGRNYYKVIKLLNVNNNSLGMCLVNKQFGIIMINSKNRNLTYNIIKP